MFYKIYTGFLSAETTEKVQKKDKRGKKVVKNPIPRVDLSLPESVREIHEAYSDREEPYPSELSVLMTFQEIRDLLIERGVQLKEEVRLSFLKSYGPDPGREFRAKKNHREPIDEQDLPYCRVTGASLYLVYQNGDVFRIWEDGSMTDLPPKKYYS